MGCRVSRRPIWGYSVCLCRIKKDARLIWVKSKNGKWLQTTLKKQPVRTGRIKILINISDYKIEGFVDCNDIVAIFDKKTTFLNDKLDHYH